jgi:hypothetical protein
MFAANLGYFAGAIVSCQSMCFKENMRVPCFNCDLSPSLRVEDFFKVPSYSGSRGWTGSCGVRGDLGDLVGVVGVQQHDERMDRQPEQREQEQQQDEYQQGRLRCSLSAAGT